ncbi:hypothetical protein GCM10017771_70400 [Streptomyces capitiformicae]|uniref:Uncharacterized protein n=1 Tax=Streptomyces capitiformicae TaxID=2014920 RepID=A0A918ZEM3_9ACTN|nr:hypothetical protein GCM10017771_70400 [Streptomyces capitiformicae]
MKSGEKHLLSPARHSDPGPASPEDSRELPVTRGSPRPHPPAPANTPTGPSSPAGGRRGAAPGGWDVDGTGRGGGGEMHPRLANRGRRTIVEGMEIPFVLQRCVTPRAAVGGAG